MRRLLRILMNVATVGSLLLCLSTIVLWVRSYRVFEHAGRVWREYDERFAWEHRQSIIVTGGGVLFHANDSRDSTEGLGFADREFDERFNPGILYYHRAYDHLDHPPAYPKVDGESDGPHDEDIDGGHRAWFRFLGFKWCRGSFDGARMQIIRNGSNAWRELVVPLWSLVLMTSLLPAMWVAAAVRRRRARRAAGAGLCPACGYDCRATPERCPECGTAIIAADGPAREGKGETEGA